jgi:hypothetical protein
MNSELALFLRSQLQSITENEIAKLSENLGGFSASMVCSLLLDTASRN